MCHHTDCDCQLQYQFTWHRGYTPGLSCLVTVVGGGAGGGGSPTISSSCSSARYIRFHAQHRSFKTWFRAYMDLLYSVHKLPSRSIKALFLVHANFPSYSQDAAHLPSAQAPPSNWNVGNWKQMSRTRAILQRVSSGSFKSKHPWSRSGLMPCPFHQVMTSPERFLNEADDDLISSDTLPGLWCGRMS